MILDRHGNPLTTPVRRAIGFTNRTLPVDSGDPLTIPRADGVSAPRDVTFGEDRQWWRFPVADKEIRT